MALPAGKLPPALLRELIALHPPGGPEIRIGPGIGLDAAAIDVEAGCLVVAADPVTMTGEGVARTAVHVNANDVAVMGVRPRWFVATTLLPLGTTEHDVRALFAELSRTLDALDISFVGGHTEITAAVRQPVVSGQMLGTGPAEQLRAASRVRPGQRIVQVGPVPIEGAAILAREPGVVARTPDDLRASALAQVEALGISIVEPAGLACELGATALHDPTEGGLSAGLFELAEASEIQLVVEPDALLLLDAGVALCAAAGVDPLGTLASGCLLAAFPVERVARALEGFRARGWRAATIAGAVSGSGVVTGGGEPLVRFERDELSRRFGDG